MAKTVLELCAGAGGQSLGFEAAGFKHVAVVDKDPHACTTVRENRPDWNVVEADLFDLDATCWHGVDVVAGGLPCPPFSIAGQQLGADDERNLFPELFRIIQETAPMAVVVENVRGLMMPRFDTYREVITDTLRSLGFMSYWTMLDAYNFGVPQHRTRTFLIGLQDHDVEFRWPGDDKHGETVGEALGSMMGEDGWSGVEDWVGMANRPAPTIVGGSRKHGGPDLGPTRARAQWAALGVDGLGMADAPPPPDFEGKPRLTTDMTAKLQGFPSEWQILGNKTQRFRQIGNALPPQLATAIAKQVIICLEE